MKLNPAVFYVKQFTPTKWDSAEQKVKFAKNFVKFVVSDFNPKYFHKWFYQRLSCCFGHIAHYNQQGFWQTFFTNNHDKYEFIRQTVNHPCYGQPFFTYSDVETVLIKWLKENNVGNYYGGLVVKDVEDRELAEYKRLKSKFEPA